MSTTSPFAVLNPCPEDGHCPIYAQPMAPVGVVGVAKASSLATTQRIASSGSVYAAAGAPGTAPAQSRPIIPGSYEDPAMIALAAQSSNACFLDKDAGACMRLNYALAAQMAAATCPNGAVTQDLLQKKKRGSIEQWLQPPVPYATVKVATNDVASVAVAAGMLPPQ